MDGETWREIFVYAERRAKEIKRFYNYEEIILNAGKGVFSDISHFHLHGYGRKNAAS